MTRRSAGNDRYRVEQKGKTRKSASAAKPKREAGAAASDKPKKKAKSSKKPSLFGMKTTREPVARVEPSPEMKKLRRWWWWFMGAAIVIAIAMFAMSSAKIVNKTAESVLFGVYAAALGGALYLEFGPLRKARLAAIDAAKATGGKAKKAAAKDADAKKAAAKDVGKAATKEPDAKKVGAKDANSKTAEAPEDGD
jgi:hypothetical protein